MSKPLARAFRPPCNAFMPLARAFMTLCNAKMASTRVPGPSCSAKMVSTHAPEPSCNAKMPLVIRNTARKRAIHAASNSLRVKLGGFRPPCSAQTPLAHAFRPPCSAKTPLAHAFRPLCNAQTPLAHAFRRLCNARRSCLRRTIRLICVHLRGSPSEDSSIGVWEGSSREVASLCLCATD